jgi:hypothetical protein
MFLVVGIFVAAWLIPLNSMAKDAKHQNVEWKDIIGIIEPENVVGSGATTVTGGGEPWSTRDGSAKVDLKTGNLEFHVKGLVFAGGKFIGTPGPITQVIGTLVCNATAGSSILINTPVVALDENGDTNFHGQVALDPVCLNGDIAFLIRIPGTSTPPWIANGAVRSIRH